MSATDCFVFRTVKKDADESKKVSLSLYKWCANFRRSNEQYSANEFSRPTRGTGYSYECTSAGTTGVREPIWPTVIDEIIQDGSVTWTCRAADVNGLNAISNPIAASDPAGLTIEDVSVEESTKILATYSGGTLDQDYEAIFTFTLNGVTRIARQLVQIRKR